MGTLRTIGRSLDAIAQGFDRAKRLAEPGIDKLLAVGAANAGLLYGTAELIDRTDFSDATNGIIMFGAGALAAAGNYLALQSDRSKRARDLVGRANAVIDRKRPLSWIKSAILAGALAASAVGLSPYGRQVAEDVARAMKRPAAVEQAAHGASQARPAVPIVTRNRPAIYDALSYDRNHAVTFSRVRLAEKEGGRGTIGRVQRTLRWEPIITAVEQKYGMPRGTLAGMIMQESYGDPVQPNAGNDGGLGLTHQQGTTAPRYGLHIFGNSTSARDHAHGAQLREMLSKCNYDPGCVQRFDERAHLIKNLDTAARIVVEGKQEHGSWDYGIEYFHLPGRIGSHRAWKYLRNVREMRDVYTNERDAARRDFNKRNPSISFDEYLRVFHDSCEDWGLATYKKG